MSDNEKGEDVEKPEDEREITEQDLWRRYMNLFVKKEEHLEAKDRLKLRKAPDLPRLPNVESEAEYPARGYPVNVFNQFKKARLPNRLKPEEKVEVWKRMKENPPVDMSSFIPEEPVKNLSKTESGIWPGVYPCENPSDPTSNVSKTGKRKFGEACSQLKAEEDVTEAKEDFADRLELGHARIPVKCPSPRSNRPMVDRSTGSNHSLVSGDYVLTETVSKKRGNRVYASICLRGLTGGMNLAELDALRVREKTWKWCFHQAIVALTAKTQLRYKHAWSGNVDYIYATGWRFFTHMGNLNVNFGGKQKFNDLGVYNYSYDVEVELVQELKDIPRMKTASFDFVEPNFGRVSQVQRKDFAKFEEKIDSPKNTDQQKTPVHKETKEIEKWFDRLPFRCDNCIFRTARYCLAFWRDGLFWYLYNPFKCDETGLWSDQGYACVVKFCSRESLKRYLMVLLVRAHAYESPKAVFDDEDVESTDEKREPRQDVFSLQIFQLIYGKCEVRNTRLLQRRMPKPRMRRIEDNKTLESCSSDQWSRKEEEIENLEDPEWLKSCKVTWTRRETSRKKPAKDIVAEKFRWHDFYVEESGKLFSLWGEIHPTQTMFSVENRGKQAYACYVVCAGMTRITAPEYWTPKTLDAIVMCGDKYYTISKIEKELKSERGVDFRGENLAQYLAGSFQIGETVFRGELLPVKTGRLYSRSSKCLWKCLEDVFLDHHFAILNCESTCIGIFKFCGAYYMCDVRSTGPPIFQYGAGAVYLIRVTCFSEFVKVVTLTIGSNECSEFQIRPILIYKGIDLGKTACTTSVGGKKRRRNSPKKKRRESCPREDYLEEDARNSKSVCRKRKAKKKSEKAGCKGQESPCQEAEIHT